MQNSINIIEGLQLRLVRIGDEPYFIATEISEHLGYTRPVCYRLIRLHCPNRKAVKIENRKQTVIPFQDFVELTLELRKQTPFISQIRQVFVSKIATNLKAAVAA